MEIYTLQGETAKALSALRQAIDAGWRNRWRFYLENNPNLDSIRNEPAFVVMVEEIRQTWPPCWRGLKKWNR